MVIMNDDIEQQMRTQRYYDAAVSTAERDTIEAILNNDNDKVAKIYLIDNPHLTNSDYIKLLQDDDTLVRKALAEASLIPQWVVQSLTSDRNAIVRANAYCNPLTPYPEFKDFVFTEKLSLKAKQLLSSNTRILKSKEIFVSLWETPSLRVNLVSRVYGAIIRPVVDNFVDIEFRRPVAEVDPEIFTFLHYEILSEEMSNAVRVEYAGADGVASPKVLDFLKKDPHRPVISAIARNSTARVSTQQYILDHHKSSGLRLSMPMSSTDNGILNRIHRETKSEDIRYWVENNPAFTLL